MCQGLIQTYTYLCAITRVLVFFYNMMNQNVKPNLLFQFYFNVVPQGPLFTKTAFCRFDDFPYIT